MASSVSSPENDRLARLRDFTLARQERDRLWERYEAAQAEGDEDNARLWWERWEAECARVERMRLPKQQEGRASD